MATKWLCDICGKPGHIYPMTEPVMKTVMVPVEIPDPEDPLKKKQIKMPKKVPETVPLRKQHTQTGNVETLEIPKTVDLEPRAIIVGLRTGQENVQKDFCTGCYETKIKPEVEKLFNLLASIESK